MGRWADTEEDAALEAKLRREKEEKKRLKAEKARRAEEERLAQLEARQAAQDDDGGRPTKRRRVTPERDGAASSNEAEAQLLRFPLRSWQNSRSVETYEKLNDIEEGTYGWVSRAKESKTGKVVALKRLKVEPSDRNGLPVTGLREIQILRDSRHDNIVRLEEVVVGDDTSKIER